MWCRGTITELIPLKSKNERKPCGPIGYKVCDIAVLEVFLIDFGSSVVLIFSGYVYRESVLSAIIVLDCCYSRGSLLRNKSSISFTHADNQIIQMTLMFCTYVFPTRKVAVYVHK